MSALFKSKDGEQVILFSSVEYVCKADPRAKEDGYLVFFKSKSHEDYIGLLDAEAERFLKEWEEYLEPKTTQSVEWLTRRVNQLAHMLDDHFRKEDPPSAATLDTLRMIIDETGK